MEGKKMRKVTITTNDMQRTRWVLLEFACNFQRIHLTEDIGIIKIELCLEDPVLGMITKTLIEQNLMETVSFQCGKKKVTSVRQPKTRAAQVMELFQDKREWTNQELIQVTGMKQGSLSNLLHNLEENELIIRKDWKTWMMPSQIQQRELEVDQFFRDMKLLEKNPAIEYFLRHEKVYAETLEKHHFTCQCLELWIKKGYITIKRKEFYEVIREPQKIEDWVERKLWEELRKEKCIKEENIRNRIPHTRWGDLNSFLKKMRDEGYLLYREQKYYELDIETKIAYFLYKHPKTQPFFIAQQLLIDKARVESMLKFMCDEGIAKRVEKNGRYLLKTPN